MACNSLLLRPAQWTGTLWIALIALSANSSALLAASSGEPIAAVGILSAVPGGERILRPAISAPIRTLPAAIGSPVRRGAVLAEMSFQDTTDVAGYQLQRLQGVQRQGASDLQAVPGNQRDGTAANFQPQPESLHSREASALNAFSAAVSEMTSATVSAPRDGYVLRQLYAVGDTSRKWRPLLHFVPVQQTILEVSVPKATRALFAPGAAIRVHSATAPSRSFRGRVESAAVSEESLVLQIRPLDLPFLLLSTASPVTLTPASRP
jgi:hypothetical protein